MNARTYVITSLETGETYVSDGYYAAGPLTTYQRKAALAADLTDWQLDNEAPDWVVARDGRIDREVNS